MTQHGELAWTADLARATQISLVAFTVGGMFVSIDTSPFLYLLAGLIVGTRALVERELTPVRSRLRGTDRLVTQAAQ